ncbi:MAG: homocysteine S-methyltransferase family protein [bacterium]
MILDRIKKGETLVGDGAMGTMLFQRGLQQGECPEALNLSKPELLAEIASLYVRAGADIVQTNTFGASPMKLAEYGLAEKTEAINSQAVTATKKAVAGRAYVSGSCGPSGQILKPYGEAAPDDLYRGFERQMRALIAAGVDVVCVETMTDLREAILAIKAAKSVSTSIPVIATMTFDATPRGFYTIMGTNVKEAAAGLQAAGADIVGSNCSNGLEKMIEIAREFKQVSASPLIIQSNAGLPENRNGVLVYPESPEFFAEKTRELVKLGVSIIGGCCGTNPDTIRAIRKTLDTQKH